MEHHRSQTVSRLAAGALVTVLLLAACQVQPPLYYWGGYEGSVGRVGGESDAFDLQAEIDALETDLERAQTSDRLVPPGFHAHLGYLLYLRGDLNGAVHQFEAEKARYPESERFIDGLLARISRPGSTAQ